MSINTGDARPDARAASKVQPLPGLSSAQPSERTQLGQLADELAERRRVQLQQKAAQRETPELGMRRYVEGVSIGIFVLTSTGLSVISPESDVVTVGRNLLTAGGLGLSSAVVGRYAISEAARDVAAGKLVVGWCTAAAILAIGSISATFGYLAVAQTKIERAVVQEYAGNVSRVIEQRLGRDSLAVILRHVVKGEAAGLGTKADCEDAEGCVSSRPSRVKGNHPVSGLLRDAQGVWLTLDAELGKVEAKSVRETERSRQAAAKIEAIAADHDLSPQERGKRIRAAIHDLGGKGSDAAVKAAVRNTIASVKAKDAAVVKDPALREGITKARGLIAASAERVEALLPQSDGDTIELPSMPRSIGFSDAYSATVLKSTWAYLLAAWIFELSPLFAFLRMIGFWRGRMDAGEINRRDHA